MYTSFLHTKEQWLAELDRLLEGLHAEQALLQVAQSDDLQRSAWTQSLCASLLKESEQYPKADVEQLIGLLFGALDSPLNTIRFWCAHTIGVLVGRHSLSFLKYAERFISPRANLTHQALIRLGFAHYLRAYLRVCNERRDILELEQRIRHEDEAMWIALLHELPEHLLSEQMYARARALQSLDGLRLVNRFVRAGYSRTGKKTGRAVLLRFERADEAERYLIASEVKVTTKLMLDSLKEMASAALKHSTIDFLLYKARLDLHKRVYNTVMHFLQMIKMEGDYATMMHARDAFMQLYGELSAQQQEEVVEELKRSIRSSSAQMNPAISRLVAFSMTHLPTHRLEQTIHFLKEQIKGNMPYSALSALDVVFHSLNNPYRLENELVSCLLSGLSHYEPAIRAKAAVYLRQLIERERLSEQAMRLVLRKLIILFGNLSRMKLRYPFMLRQSMTCIRHYLLQAGPLTNEKRPAVFFPGSFDPFSIGHEEIAKKAVEMGYDVYLAIDEFSWSKNTMPNNIRREIMRLSIADELHLYEFPMQLSVNLSNPQDLRQLREVLGQEVSILVGDDVINNASAYKAIPQEHSVHTFPHLVFTREGEDRGAQSCKRHGLHCRFVTLRGYEEVSSSVIRLQLDREATIEAFIDPMAKNFIYARNLYQNRSLSKHALTVHPVELTKEQTADALIYRECAGDIEQSVVRFDLAERPRLESVQGSVFSLSDALNDLQRSGVETLQTALNHPHLEEVGFHEGFVDLSRPNTVHFDLEDLIHEDYLQDDRLQDALSQTRSALRKAIVALCPGQYLASFSQQRVYERLLQKICRLNGVPTQPTEPRQLGPFLAVPFGEILKKRLIPNTVTKSLHTEKYFDTSTLRWHIDEYPEYMDLESQVNMIRSFGRDIILIDDLLNKGYRLNRLIPLIRERNIPIRELFIGIMSSKGMEHAAKFGLSVDYAYFVPNLQVWFQESKLYPYLGGDAIAQSKQEIKATVLPSLNLIKPYSRIPYLRGISEAKQLAFSKVCLNNAILILSTMETIYQEKHHRFLQLRNLPEVLLSARYPYHGTGIEPAENKKPSELLRMDLELLERLSYE